MYMCIYVEILLNCATGKRFNRKRIEIWEKFCAVGGGRSPAVAEEEVAAGRAAAAEGDGGDVARGGISFGVSAPRRDPPSDRRGRAAAGEPAPLPGQSTSQGSYHPNETRDFVPFRFAVLVLRILLIDELTTFSNPDLLDLAGCTRLPQTDSIALVLATFLFSFFLSSGPRNVDVSFDVLSIVNAMPTRLI